MRRSGAVNSGAEDATRVGSPSRAARGEDGASPASRRLAAKRLRGSTLRSLRQVRLTTQEVRATSVRMREIASGRGSALVLGLCIGGCTPTGSSGAGRTPASDGPAGSARVRPDPNHGAATKGPPPTRRADVVDEIHGERVPDPYR